MLAFFKHISLGGITWALCLYGLAQCPTHQEFWDKVISSETANISDKQKLQQFFSLKEQYENCGLVKDSVYARILHRIGGMIYLSKGSNTEAIQHTMQALRINASGKQGACLSFVANSYSNIGLYYYQLLSDNQALLYFDSSISASLSFPEKKNLISFARFLRGNIFYRKGNYEKDVEETSLGLTVAVEMKDTAGIIDLLLERAQAYEMQNRLDDATNDVNKSMSLLQNSENYNQWANAYRYKSDIVADQHNCNEALRLYKKAIEYRIKTEYTLQIATDYNDAGYMLMYKCKNPGEAKKFYTTAFQIATAITANHISSFACNNLAEISFAKKDYLSALLQYQQALQYLVPSYKLKDSLTNPSFEVCKNVERINFLEQVLDNKARCLLYQYKETKNNGLLRASIATSLLTDSVLASLRHEQGEEKSKLYWRDFSREFFTNALEACYLGNDPKLAFFFMEKSRAVLLNDKLNELGATAAHLPKDEVAKRDKLQVNIIEQQQKLLLLGEHTAEYNGQLQKVLETKDEFERYIRSLEKKYPAYYQYKYADEVPSLPDLQKYLAANKQSFVHYFINDTVAYILGITPNNTKLIKLSKNDFDPEQLNYFLQLCSNKQALNNNYSSFVALSNNIYKSLFEPLQLPKGRVVICADNFLIPFDALCSDAEGKHFLIYDYAFSYVYSARYLMKQFDNPFGKGNFLGIAPVSFAAYLQVPGLKQSAAALEASAAYYSRDKLLTDNDATRRNFIQQMGGYTIVNVFSHARADSSDSEPKLFMRDSVIHLSELQLLNNPATKLVVLSACQTNVGKNATGEGIYSLARGFASAGIPSVAATLWKADEQMIYMISEKFHQYLSQGMNKDEALQKAKLYFIQNGDNEKLLPYYWANMILMGDARPVALTVDNTMLWLIGAGITIFIIIVIFVWKRKRIR